MDQENNIAKNSRPGIYLIEILPTGLIYVGKSGNLYKRKCQYKSIIKGNKPSRLYNIRFITHLQRHDFKDIKFTILEYTEKNDLILSERETYWINYYKSNNRNIGYNLNTDSSTKTIVSEETKNLISERLKKEWSLGIRKNHNKKLSDSWRKRGIEASLKQTEQMRKSLTKYIYRVTFANGTTSEMKYKELKKNNLYTVLAEFAKRKTNIYQRKTDGIIIERIKLEDIVQTSAKVEE